MPSDIENKRFLEDKVMPFFDKDLGALLDRLNALEEKVALLEEGLDAKAFLEIAGTEKTMKPARPKGKK